MELKEVINICVGELGYRLVDIEVKDGYKVEFYVGRDYEDGILTVEKINVGGEPAELNIGYWKPLRLYGDKVVRAELKLNFKPSEKEFRNRAAFTNAVATLVVVGNNLGEECP